MTLYFQKKCTQFLLAPRLVLKKNIKIKVRSILVVKVDAQPKIQILNELLSTVRVLASSFFLRAVRFLLAALGR